MGNPGVSLARRGPRVEALKARTVAVTGGAGFIGSHLCDAILETGARVVCIDNFHTGRRANIEHLVYRPGFEVVEHDVSEPLPDALPRFDQIYNFACPASPVHYQENRVRTALTCAQGAMNILDRADRDGARVLHASTSEIYGDPEVHPQSEDYFGNVNPVGPRSCYDEGKRFAETLLTDFAAQAGLDVRIIRIFNTYGPRMRPDDGRVVSNFVTQALQGETITIYGDGAQTRSFCFIDDLVRGCIRAMNSPTPLPGPVNLGNPQETTVGELAHLIVSMTGSASDVSFRPLPVDDPRRRRPDIRRALECLEWSPEVPLQAGLERTIRYFMDQDRGRSAVGAPRPGLAEVAAPLL